MSPSHFVRGVIVRGSAEIRNLNKSYCYAFNLAFSGFSEIDCLRSSHREHPMLITDLQ